MGSQGTLDALSQRLKMASIAVYDSSPERPKPDEMLPASAYPYVVLYGDSELATFNRRAGIPSHRTMRIQAMLVGLTPAQCRWAADQADSMLTLWHPSIEGRVGYRCRSDWAGEMVRDDDIPSRPLFSITNRYTIQTIVRDQDVDFPTF